MKVGLSYITQIRKADDPETKGGFIAQTFNQLAASIPAAYHTEHNDDDTHGNVHALTLTVSGQPRCSAWSSALQSIPSAVFTALTLDTNDYDVGGMHSTVTTTSRFTVPVTGAGTYVVNGTTRMAPMAAGTQCGIAIFKNGAQGHTLVRGPINANSDIEISAFLLLVGGDVLELYAYQDSGGAINFGATVSPVATRLTAIKLL